MSALPLVQRQEIAELCLNIHALAFLRRGGAFRNPRLEISPMLNFLNTTTLSLRVQHQSFVLLLNTFVMILVYVGIHFDKLHIALETPSMLSEALRQLFFQDQDRNTYIPI